MDINLTEISYDDIEIVRKWRNSNEVSQFMYSNEVISKEQQELWWEKIKEDNSSIFWIIEYNDKKIGLASLTGISQILSSCYWAFYLGDEVPRGGGIGSKIEFKVLDYVFSNLKLNKLRCEVMVFNENVISMHEKFGFRREAYYRKHVKKNGKWIDTIGLAILNEEWKVYREGLKEKIYR